MIMASAEEEHNIETELPPPTSHSADDDPTPKTPSKQSRPKTMEGPPPLPDRPKTSTFFSRNQKKKNIPQSSVSN